MQLQYVAHLANRGTSEKQTWPARKLRGRIFWTTVKERHLPTWPTIAEQPFDAALEFFSDADRQRRMEESETHHDRAPLAGVVRELESLAPINQFLSTFHAQRSQRLRQAIGVLVRMIMERRGWRKSGKKGSLGVRSARVPQTPNHNNGGLAFWFVRAERYELAAGHAVPHRARALQGI